MSTPERVTCTIEAGVAEVQLNRADKHNGLDPAMFEAVVAAGEQLAEDRSVRVVILSGAGPSFCAGLDFKAFISGGEAAREQLLAWKVGQLGNLAQRLAWVWTTVPAPVIAAVHGTCVGGGLQLALAADLRVVHPDTTLAVREIEYGMIPDMSISKTLSRLVRLDVAKELTFTGRDFTGREAVELGVATRSSEDPLATAREIAAQIAKRSPDAVRAAKQLWNHAPGLGDEAALRLETALQLPLLGSRNQLEAVQARFMKREPQFHDPS
ncbi:Enoyl-CoA hydratase [Enhygromyxa salina]|uniref:Enoyl-CoA hydratase n=1 Tax=Enhygromyxa salina TaxID=215803 RepID=A0A0C2D1E9_9BACT|nr:crotonase/enoyl-CoA hydratase family protein [Enhygromyxa salina]KIG15640.1 Enoyl-CoA hydratase [Enhygromyxa salina]